MNSQGTLVTLFKALLWLLVAALLGAAAGEFYNIALGTGGWLGGFSLKWGAAFLIFAMLCLVSSLVAAIVLWQPGKLSEVSGFLVATRNSLRATRWLVAAVTWGFPIWLLQYSPWGVVFGRPYIRLLIWFIVVLILAFLIERDARRISSWIGLLTALLISGAGFVLALPFAQVTNYPFALGWSEGNRLWDYSLLFGLNRYQFPTGNAPRAYLEPGRQFVGGLPFLVPQLSITAERLWLALLDVLPYLILGWLIFRPPGKPQSQPWFLAGLWAFMFLNQGPIHAPLIVCAILVALAWGQSLWLAAALVLCAGFFAELSRFTWIFAPAMWAVMLEFGSAAARGSRMPRQAWIRAITLGVAGLFGSLGLPRLLAALRWDAFMQSGAPGVAAGGVSVQSVTIAASKQPLLWYRLFPNATYGSGILLGLLIAAAPISIVLLYLALRNWKLNWLQKLTFLLPLVAFLIVGLVISTKIGGGGDLHNMDMLLIGLLFVVAVACRVVGSGWIESVPGSSFWIRGLLVLAIMLPAVQPLMALRPINFARDANWLLVLTDASRPKDLGSLPANDVVATELGKLNADVKRAQPKGDVLFMDQRQLLTFGYLSNVPLVPDYEKKRMMDEALSGNTSYFAAFYKDLAAHRFSLIVTDPLKTPIKDSDYGFGEENNAWVKWVARPVLCYYDEMDTLTNVKVELLIPHNAPVDCAGSLP